MAATAQHAAIRHEVTAVLHMSSYSIPLKESGSGLKHFLLCDSLMRTLGGHEATEDRYGALANEFHALDEQIVRSISHFFPLSEYLAGELEAYGIPPDRITVVGTGPGNVTPSLRERDWTNSRILFVARDRFSEKGGQLLLEAFRLASKEAPNLQLIIVTGDRAMRSLKSEDNVAVRRDLSPPELEELFSSVSLFAMPALAEPWGLVYLESLAVGTPILGLDRFAFPELSGQGEFGLIAREPTPRAVAEELVKAATNPELLRRKGEQGHRHCARYRTWKRMAATISETIERELQS